MKHSYKKVPIAALCCMAAINVAITKTPVSTTIILTVLSDTTILPVIAISSFTSFLLTSNIDLLKPQRARTAETLSGLTPETTIQPLSDQ